MNVLSLFDGMSCGQIALNRCGIKYDKYFASEIKKEAIQVTQYNYPNTIQLGDIKKIKASDLPKIDLILAGSPCQEIKPKYWLLENVKMAAQEYQYISNLLKTYPSRINSSLVSAQMRDRLYWVNFGEEYRDLFNFRYSDIPQPKDKKILFKDIIESGYVTAKKAYCILTSEARPHKSNRRRFIRWKISGFVNIIFTKENLSPFHNRFLSKLEMERLQTVPKNYTKPLTRNQAASVLGDGWTIDVICHILQRIKNE